MIRFHASAATVAALVVAFSASSVNAHGFAGDRFFPATIQTDDPFVADEMSLPTVTRNPTDGDGTKETDVGVDFAKRITTDLGFTFSDQWRYIRPAGQPKTTGLDDFSTGLQYQLFVDAPHEAMALIGLNVNWGHTGRVQNGGFGADDFTTLSPTFDFGKGFGDLPDSLSFLKPFAITSNLSVDFPTKPYSTGAANPNNFNAGFAIEYSLEYLQHHVKDVGLSAPFDRMIPLVEITSTTPFNRLDDQDNVTTGLIAPGVIWAGQYYQIGAEALIPYGNHQQGHGYGGIVQFHLFLDDIFPDSIGKPILGN